jgi:small-conductance mechanosensitive channel
MNESIYEGIVRSLTLRHLALALGVVAIARFVAGASRLALRSIAGRAAPRRRLIALRAVPLVRLSIWIAAAAAIIPIVVEPTVANIVALLATGTVVLAFAFKDYASSLIAGIVVVLENTYQPGDWIEMDGTYGEVKAIGTRAVHIVTADDTEVIIPHSKLWSSSVFNATSGNHALLCVATFYLHPDHDAAAVRRRLIDVGEESMLRATAEPVVVVVAEKPWGTQYRLKAYAQDSSEQFLFTTDLTIRGKAALREMGIPPASAPYAEVDKAA